MSEYAPIYEKPYPGGWKNKPDETTPVTAEIMDNYDNAIENIEKYLEDNSIGGSSSESVNLTDLAVENSISIGRKNASEIGEKSIAVGNYVEASGICTHAEGWYTTAAGDHSHAEGNVTTAKGTTSHTEGLFTVAEGDCQHVQGKYNVEDTEGRYAHIVGGGTAPFNRKNIHTLDWEGNAEFTGTVKSAGLRLMDTDTAQEYMVTISNGSLEITAV